MHKDFNIREYYKRVHLTRNILFLYTNRLLIQVAIGMLSVFTAIFFYEKFNQSYTAVALVFTAVYGIFVLFIPLGAMLLRVLGTKHMLIIAVIFLPGAILSLLLWDTNPMLSLGMYLLFGTIYRTFYWTPYHIDFALFTDKKVRGKQMSLLLNASEIVLAVTPFFAGLVIAFYGFDSLFIITSAFLAVSIIPLFFIEDTRETFSFGYFETYRKLFKKENRTLFMAYFGEGVQHAVQMAIWPIFIYLLLKGEYVALGLITSATIFLLILTRFLIGNLADRWDKKRLLKYGTFFATTGWLLKAFIETGFQIMVIDTYHRVGRAVNKLSFDIATYDQAVDNGHYIDEYTVLKEIALNMGRTTLFISSIWITAAFGFTSAFIFAAGATLLMTLLNKEVFLQ